MKSDFINIRFSDGAYHEVVLPVLRNWLKRGNEEFEINGSSLKIIDADEGKDLSKKHVDSKITVMVDNEKIVIHAYNTTQNVMVQGRKREKFVRTILEPYLWEQIQSAEDRIDRINRNDRLI